MLKHDSSEETKTYSADSYEERKSAERAKNKGLKKDIIDIQRKLLNHTKTSLYTPTFLKTFKKIFIR
jgi:hypothetical protein